MALLTNEEKDTFQQNGYLLKHGMVSEGLIARAVEAIWNRIDADKEDASTWVRGGKEGSQGDVSNDADIQCLMYDSPLFEMLEELTASGRLVALHPKDTSVNLRYPTGEEEWTSPGGSHVDGHGFPNLSINNWTVAVTLYLNDVKPQAGGTCVWPGSHKLLAEHFKTHSRLSLSRALYTLPIYDGEPRSTRPTELFELGDYEEISGAAGTAMIWHSHLVHSASMNCGDEIRMAAISRFRWANWNDLRFEDPDDMWAFWEGLKN